MNRQKLLSRWSLVGGILVALIGVLHTSATPMAYKSMLPIVGDKTLGVAYFFAVMGLFVIFSGWLMIYCSRGLGRAENWAWMMTMANGLCNILAGAGAVFAGFRHGLVIIWIAAVTSTAVLAAVLHGSYRAGKAA